MAFYKMEIDRERKFVEGNEANDWESIVCVKSPGHQRAGRRITKLHLDILSWNVVDFSRTMLSDIVVTDRAREILQDAKLTGFIVNRAEVVKAPARPAGSTLPKVWEFVAVGRGGLADKKSGIVKLRECAECGLVEYSAFKSGIIVDTTAYDGSDFFTVAEYPKYVLVSERAKAVIETHRLTNVALTDSTKLKWPSGVVEPR